MEVSEVIELETVSIHPISSIEDLVSVVAIVDTGDGLDRMHTSFPYTPSEWPVNEQFQKSTGKPTESQVQWLAALGDWQTLPMDDF
jgi:hypothetical protein